MFFSNLQHQCCVIGNSKYHAHIQLLPFPPSVRRVPTTTCTTTLLAIILACLAPWKIPTAFAFKGKTFARNSVIAPRIVLTAFPDVDVPPARFVGGLSVCSLWFVVCGHCAPDCPHRFPGCRWWKVRWWSVSGRIVVCIWSVSGFTNSPLSTGFEWRHI